MKKTHLYLLALLLSVVGVSAIVYKWKVLKFPLAPVTEVDVWTVQARIEYTPRRGPNTVTLQIPKQPPGFAVLDERFIANNYSRLEEERGNSREVQWAIRRARGTQALYYRATVVRAVEHAPLGGKAKVGQPPILEEPYATAAASLLEDVRQGSADILTFAQELVRRMNAAQPTEQVALLLENKKDVQSRATLIAELLSSREIPARIIQGFLLGENEGAVDVRPWLQVHNGTDWLTIDLRNAADGWPENLLLWSTSTNPLLTVEDNPRAQVEFTVSRNLADAMAIAERRLEVQHEHLVRYSLLSLPLQTQQVYRVLLLIPIGAFIMLLLRNLIGVKTYGTFMPVLVALAFRDTGVIAGVLLFVSVVGSGLLVR